MKLSRTHLCIDLYDVNALVAGDVINVNDLLQKINELLFESSGVVRLIPVFNEETAKKQNNGISGIVVLEKSHFTIHTFSQRGVVFVDYFGYDPANGADKYEQGMLYLLREHFGSCRLVVCGSGHADGNPIEGASRSFGTHLILETNRIPLDKAILLPKEIMHSIGMAPLSQQLAIVGEDDFGIIQPIAESHIGLHSCGERTFIDVFSCKPFDTYGLLKILYQRSVEIVRTHDVDRGVLMVDKKL